MSDDRRTVPSVIGLGEVLWDLFPNSRQPGGATANVAFHTTQLGCIGAVASRVGDDELGRELRDYLIAHGLETSLVQDDDEAPTGTVTVELTDDGHHFVIHEDVAWDRLAWTPSLQAAIRSADAICFGTLGQRSPLARETIQQCLWEASDDCLLVFDVNVRQHFYDRMLIERSLQSAKMVKLNAEEVTLLAELLEWPSGDLASFASRVRDNFGVELVCITRGEHGCWIGSETECVDVLGLPVQVVDTVGAGDAFTAALIVAQLRGWPLRDSAEFANQVGALVASRRGAMPELVKEYNGLCDRFQRRES